VVIFTSRHSTAVLPYALHRTLSGRYCGDEERNASLSRELNLGRPLCNLDNTLSKVYELPLFNNNNTNNNNETSRFAHYLDNRLTDGGEVVSLTRRQSFTPRKIAGTHFY
jgi:hypothetical protein